MYDSAPYTPTAARIIAKIANAVIIVVENRSRASESCTRSGMVLMLKTGM